MKRHKFAARGEIELFPGKGGWHYVRVPKKITKETKDLADRGLVAITATLGGSTWETSLLPMGDGSHFIAINAKVREREGVGLGDNVRVTFELRDRASRPD